MHYGGLENREYGLEGTREDCSGKRSGLFTKSLNHELLITSLMVIRNKGHSLLLAVEASFKDFAAK